MGYQHKENRGSAYKNERRREGKNDPDYTGSGNHDGTEIWVDIWIENKPGTPTHDSSKKTFLSLRFRNKQEQSQDTRQREERRPEQQQRRTLPPPPLHSKPEQSKPKETRATEKVNSVTGEYDQW